MKLSLIGMLVLSFSTMASADSFSDNCDSMREHAVILSTNLQAISKNELNIALEAAKEGKQIDLKSSNEGIINIADTIDRLNYKINQQCK
ncbi:MAG: hypothetical protein AB7F59_04380 [Bdellovibrionales bacterium]